MPKREKCHINDMNILKKVCQLEEEMAQLEEEKARLEEENIYLQDKLTISKTKKDALE
jgi:hypothetical protein